MIPYAEDTLGTFSDSSLSDLNIWFNAQAHMEALYPEELNLDAYGDMSIEEPLVGANGYVLLDLPRDSKEPANARYSVYDTIDREWFQISVPVTSQPYGWPCLGRVKPIFAVMEDDGLIQIYDIPSGTQTAAFETGLINSSIRMHQWILEDRYLAFLTRDYYLLIYDTTTGELVYRYQDYGFSISMNIMSDSQGKRLYIWDEFGSSGLCVDIGNWITLVEIPDMEYYDPKSDLIYQLISTDEDDKTAEQLITLRLPTTEELVALGHVFLGQ